jgi:hypothetical protein
VRQEIADFTSFYLYSFTRGIPHALRAGAWPRITRFDYRWRWPVKSVVPRFRRFDADTLRPTAFTRRRATASCAPEATAPATAQPGEQVAGRPAATRGPTQTSSRGRDFLASNR